MISYYPVVVTDKDRHPVCPFLPYQELDFSDLARMIATYHWNPAVFKDNYRKQDNWLSADLVALDFDDGMTLEDAKETFRDFKCVIGTTISHQLEKNGKVNDRFRVVLALDKVCHSKDDYRSTLGTLIEEYGADPTGKDPSHYYRACTRIEHLTMSGLSVPLQVTAPWKIKEKADIKEAQISHYQKTGELPKFVREFLQGGQVYKTGRNATAFAVGMMLYDLGYSLPDIHSLLERSPISREKWNKDEMKNIVVSISSRIKRNKHG